MKISHNSASRSKFEVVRSSSVAVTTNQNQSRIEATSEDHHSDVEKLSARFSHPQPELAYSHKRLTKSLLSHGQIKSLHQSTDMLKKMRIQMKRRQQMQNRQKIVELLQY